MGLLLFAPAALVVLAFFALAVPVAGPQHELRTSGSLAFGDGCLGDIRRAMGVGAQLVEADSLAALVARGP